MTLTAINRLTQVNFNLLATPLKGSSPTLRYTIDSNFLTVCKEKLDYFSHTIKCNELKERIARIEIKKRKCGKGFWPKNSIRLLGIALLTLSVTGAIFSAYFTTKLFKLIILKAKTEAAGKSNFLFIFFTAPMTILSGSAFAILPFLPLVPGAFGLYLIFRPRHFLLRFAKSCKNEKKQLGLHQQKMKNCLNDRKRGCSLVELIQRCRDYRASLKLFSANDIGQQRSLKSELKNIESHLNALIEIKTNAQNM